MYHRRPRRLRHRRRSRPGGARLQRRHRSLRRAGHRRPRHQRRGLRRRQGGQGARRAVISPSATNPHITDPRRRQPHLAHRRQRQPAGQGAGHAAADDGEGRHRLRQRRAPTPTASRTPSSRNFPAAPVATALGFTGGDTNGMTPPSRSAAADAPGFALLIADFDAPPLIAALAKARRPGDDAVPHDRQRARSRRCGASSAATYTVMARVRGTGPANPSFSDPSGMAFSVLQHQLQERSSPAKIRPRPRFVGQRLRRLLRGRHRRRCRCRRPAAAAPPSSRRWRGCRRRRRRRHRWSARPTTSPAASTTLRCGGTHQPRRHLGPHRLRRPTATSSRRRSEVWSIDTTGASRPSRPTASSSRSVGHRAEPRLVVKCLPCRRFSPHRLRPVHAHRPPRSRRHGRRLSRASRGRRRLRAHRRRQEDPRRPQRRSAVRRDVHQRGEDLRRA